MGPNGPEPDMDADAVRASRERQSRGAKVAGGLAGRGEQYVHGMVGPVGHFLYREPDADPSGLAAWTEDLFIKAIREGKHMGTSRPILPPMPWPVYRNFTDDDLKAIFAYLQVDSAREQSRAGSDHRGAADREVVAGHGPMVRPIASLPHCRAECPRPRWRLRAGRLWWTLL